MTDPRILYITNGGPGYMPPLRLGMRQVEMGPNMPDAITADGRVRLSLPSGDIQPAELLSRLPSEFSPDLVFIQASSYRCAKPIKLTDLPGRKFLVIADIHHGANPIVSMLRYVENETFDGVIVTHGAHFAHWFEEWNECPVTVIPNFNVAGHSKPFQTQREPTILFIGQADKFHPRRRHLLDAIKAAGLPLIEGQAEPKDAARLYGEAQIVFNCSLNGDINMRVFEVLAAGGCLVTDRLSPQAGLEEIFEDGKHLASYTEEAELISLLRRLLANPLLALSLAEEGHRAYWQNHAPEIRKEQMLAFALNGREPGIISTNQRAPNLELDVMTRAGIYEQLQEIHRKLLTPTPFLVDPDLPEILAEDAADLHLLRRQDWSGHSNQTGVILAASHRNLAAKNGQTIVVYSRPAHQV